MSSSVSLEYLESLYGANNGIAQLDSTGALPDSVLPDSAFGAYLGDYASIGALQTAHATATYGQYATVAGETYYYNAAMEPAAWTAVSIEVSQYRALTPAQIAGQPKWVIIADIVTP